MGRGGRGSQAAQRRRRRGAGVTRRSRLPRRRSRAPGRLAGHWDARERPSSGGGAGQGPRAPAPGPLPLSALCPPHPSARAAAGAAGWGGGWVGGGVGVWGGDGPTWPSRRRSARSEVTFHTRIPASEPLHIRPLRPPVRRRNARAGGAGQSGRRREAAVAGLAGSDCRADGSSRTKIGAARRITDGSRHLGVQMRAQTTRSRTCTC